MEDSAVASCVRESARELGYNSLKDKQLEAAVAVLSGRDVFVALPTGYGVTYAKLPTGCAFDKYKGTGLYKSVPFSSVLYTHSRSGKTGSIILLVRPSSHAQRSDMQP